MDRRGEGDDKYDIYSVQCNRLQDDYSVNEQMERSGQVMHAKCGMSVGRYLPLGAEGTVQYLPHHR